MELEPRKSMNTKVLRRKKAEVPHCEEDVVVAQERGHCDGDVEGQVDIDHGDKRFIGKLRHKRLLTSALIEPRP
ncbi:hypothetical protein VIGAN_06177800 [Vigna angularis var. angularis]|uniref:Uncharacterized protein n=1 Tax=Vigna angularis var. angularis TaxID=157739 RepID=A0A0S3SCB7_PHAAN|nr:hypothetical protein VIGAN_06177800 [Vigna angularis var. angularis]